MFDRHDRARTSEPRSDFDPPRRRSRSGSQPSKPSQRSARRAIVPHRRPSRRCPHRTSTPSARSTTLEHLPDSKLVRRWDPKDPEREHRSTVIAVPAQEHRRLQRARRRSARIKARPSMATERSRTRASARNRYSRSGYIVQQPSDFDPPPFAFWLSTLYPQRQARAQLVWTRPAIVLTDDRARSARTGHRRLRRTRRRDICPNQSSSLDGDSVKDRKDPEREHRRERFFDRIDRAAPPTRDRVSIHRAAVRVLDLYPVDPPRGWLERSWYGRGGRSFLTDDRACSARSRPSWRCPHRTSTPSAYSMTIAHLPESKLVPRWQLRSGSPTDARACCARSRPSWRCPHRNIDAFSVLDDDRTSARFRAAHRSFEHASETGGHANPRREPRTRLSYPRAINRSQ